MDIANRVRIPRPLILLRLLWRCFFCVVAVLLGNGVLMAVPQLREALQLFAADAFTEGRWLASLFYVLAVLYWAGSAWFVSRILLGRKFERDSLGADPDDPFVEWVAAVLPRVLASVATLPLAVLTWQAHRGLGALTAFVSLLFMLELVFRPRFGDTDNTGHRIYGEFDMLGPNGRHACMGLLALSFTLLAGIWSLEAGRLAAAAWALAVVVLHVRSRHAEGDAQEKQTIRRALATNLLAALFVLAMLLGADDEIAMARDMGSPAILLCALAGWTLFGGLALTYWPMSRGWPGMAAWLPPLLLGLGSLFETHWVAQRPLPANPTDAAFPSNQGAGEPGDWRSTRSSLSAHFGAWVAQHPPGEPVYFAAVVGGASRAAYWTGSVLSQLEQQARAADRRFANNMYAMSSISGGSLGATAWVADLAQRPATAGGATLHHLRVRDFLSQDFLSPVVARWLFPDLALRFVPFPLLDAWTDEADRSLGLEKAWVQDWRRLSTAPAAPSASSPAVPLQPSQIVHWDQPITALYQTGQRNAAGRLPTLLLNTVRLEDGQRFVQAPVRTTLPGVLDLLEPRLDTSRLSLAQAVHNSARFPYVSPAALLLPAPAAAPASAAAPHSPHRDRKPTLGRLGDGGYHEASGAATLADLLETLQQDGWLRTLPERMGLWTCAGGWPDGATTCTLPSRVVALVIDGEPQSYPGSLVRGLDGARLDRASDTGAPGMALSELLAPVFGGLSTRTRLSIASQQRLSQRVGHDAGALIELRMPLWRHPYDDQALLLPQEPEAAKCARHDRQPSMNWALDACSRARMDFAAGAAGPTAFGAHPSLAQQALLANLGRLRGWILTDNPMTKDSR